MRLLDQACAFATLTLASATVALGALPVSAQAPQGIFDRLQIEQERARDTDPAAHVQVEPRRIPRDLVLSDRLRLIDRPVIPMAEGGALRLPLDLHVLQSADGRTVVQYGDALMRMHPVRTDIFWIGDDGAVRAEVRDRFDGEALLDISADGYLSVVGGAFLSEVPPGSPKPKSVVIFDPAGNVANEATLDAETAVAQIVSLPRGAGAVMAAAPVDDPLADNRLLLMRDGEVTALRAEGFGILQKVIWLGRDGLVFVQGSDGFGVVDALEGTALWRNPGRIRLVGPKAVALDPSSGRLFLMTGDRMGSDDLYRWTATVLDAQTGEGLAQRPLEGNFAGTNADVFLNFGRDRVDVAQGERRLTISVRPR